MDGELLRAEAELIQIQFWEDYGIRLTFLVTKYMTGNKTEVRIVIFIRCTIFYVNNLKVKVVTARMNPINGFVETLYTSGPDP